MLRRGNYLLLVGRSCVDQILELVAHRACSDVAACVVIVECGLALGVSPVLVHWAVEFSDHCFSVSSHA